MGQERDIYDRNNKDQEKNATTILSARIHEYQRPLSIDDIPKPRISTGEQVLVKVATAGLCHSDLHLINGQWKDIIPIQLPITPGPTYITKSDPCIVIVIVHKLLLKMHHLQVIVS